MYHGLLYQHQFSKISFTKDCKIRLTNKCFQLFTVLWLKCLAKNDHIKVNCKMKQWKILPENTCPFKDGCTIKKSFCICSNFSKERLQIAVYSLQRDQMELRKSMLFKRKDLTRIAITDVETKWEFSFQKSLLFIYWSFWKWGCLQRDN